MYHFHLCRAFEKLKQASLTASRVRVFVKQGVRPRQRLGLDWIYNSFTPIPSAKSDLMPLSPSKNVLGQPLVACSFDPLTGFFRDGCCKTNEEDMGSHLVCAIVTDSFLTFSKKTGNDLSTPRPQWDFPGLKAGDQWCVCVNRWIEAHEAGYAPKLRLESTHSKALEFVSIEVLRAYEAAFDD